MDFFISMKRKKMNCGNTSFVVCFIVPSHSLPRTVPSLTCFWHKSTSVSLCLSFLSSNIIFERIFRILSIVTLLSRTTLFRSASKIKCLLLDFSYPRINIIVVQSNSKEKKNAYLCIIIAHFSYRYWEQHSHQVRNKNNFLSIFICCIEVD